MILACSWVASGCGGSTSSALQNDALRTAAPRMLNLNAKAVSGAPVGIWVTWTRVEGAVGYYLYRDDEPIPDPNPDGAIDPLLRVNGGSQVPQEAGDPISFQDIFPLVVGQTYYYRVTAVDSEGVEGYASNELTWMVHGQSVSGLDPWSGYWGDTLIISGDTFGVYDFVTDSVQFPAIGGGTVAGVIAQPADWTDTQITVTIPPGSVTGKVSVVINGTVAQSDDDLTILNAYIANIDPNPGFLEQNITISGGNFGAEQNASTIFLGTQDLSPALSSWSDTAISLTVPADALSGAIVITANAHSSNAAPFVARAEILSTDPPAAQTGEWVVLSGRMFGDTPGRVLLDGTTELATQNWQADSVQCQLAGDTGAHTLTVETAALVLSNDYDYQFVEPLTITMSGLDALTVYRGGTPIPITATTAADAQQVFLSIDGQIVAPINEPPFDTVTLPISALSNGQHEVRLRARRRGIEVQSDPVMVTAYSLVGDVNGDGVVDTDDALALPGMLLRPASDPAYRIWQDCDEDGMVTEADLSAIGYYFGNVIDTLELLTGLS
jgi:hypothetical protein